MPKLMIATPAYGEIFYAPYLHSVLALAKHMHKAKWDFIFESVSYAEVSEARNYLVTRFFDKTDATHLLFIDADMGFPQKLVPDMVSIAKPVVGVIAPKRQMDFKRLADLARNESDLERAVSKAHQFVVRSLRSAAPKRNGFIEVEGCGAGILLIERGCIAALLRQDPGLNDTTVRGRTPLMKGLDRLIRAFDPVVRSDGARLSEDFAFCHRWRALCGGEVWASVGHKITHVGLHHFTARYSDVEPDQAPGPAKPRVVISPKMAVTANERVERPAGAKRPEPKAGARPAVTIHLKSKAKPTRH